MRALGVVMAAAVIMIAFGSICEAYGAESSRTIVERLQQVKELYDAGILTEEEYERRRASLVEELDRSYEGEVVPPMPEIIGEILPAVRQPFSYAGRFYIGLGWLNTFRSGSAGSITLSTTRHPFIRPSLTRHIRLEFDQENTDGFNFKAGYFISEDFAVEGLFQLHNNYSIRDDYYRVFYYANGYDRVNASIQGHIETLDFSINAKAFILRGRVRPYFVAGLGYLRTTWKWGGFAWTNTYLNQYQRTFFSQNTYDDQSTSFSEVLGRVGVGCNLFIIDSLGVEVEFSRDGGLSEGYDFWGLSLNALYVF